MGVIAGMAGGMATGILNTAFSGGSGDDYLNAIAQGGAYGGLTGFATSAVLAGIGAVWEALGNIKLPESDLGEDFWGTPNYPTSAWSNNWFVKTYQFISNIGNGASNASIIGTTGGFMTSDEFANALAALGPTIESSLNMNLFPRSTTKPMYTGSSLSFDGSTLTWTDSYSDGSQTIRGTWSAQSGPYGNGHLPNGTYNASNLQKTTTNGMVRDNVGFKLYLDPTFNTSRFGLYIHPMGGNGTLGCIGITESADMLNKFYNLMFNYLSDNSSITITVSRY
jgi:hypothetical protein